MTIGNRPHSDGNPPPSSRKSQMWTWVLGLAVVLLAIWMINAFTNSNPETTGTSGVSTGPEDEPVVESVTPQGQEEAIIISEESELSDDPNRYANKNVIIEGEINEVLAPSLFTIDTDGAIGGDEVLVYTPSQQQGIREDTRVRVQGRVEMLTLEELRQRTNSDFGADIYGDVEFRPVVVAETTTTIMNR